MEETVQQTSAPENIETTTDGVETEGFLEGLTGEETTDAENQREPENKPTETEESSAENQRAADSKTTTEKKEEQPSGLQFKYNGQAVELPAESVEQVAAALGTTAQDIVNTLQKGRNYDAKEAAAREAKEIKEKAERSMRILDSYAKAAGMDRDSYISELEKQADNAQMQAELARVQQEFPGITDAAAQEIATQRAQERKQAEAQEQQRYLQHVKDANEKIQQAAVEAKKQQMAETWKKFLTVSGLNGENDVPERVGQIMQEQKVDPVTAWYAYKAEQAQTDKAALEKEQKNRKSTPGSLKSAGDEGDPFLAGLFGD